MSLEIIAEAAQGFLGDPSRKTLALAAFAAAAGADAVKFQLVYADELCTAEHRHYQLFKNLEMPDLDWQAVAERCREKKIFLYLDIFGERSLELACRIGAHGLKLHSTDVLNLPLIRQVAKASIQRVVLSAGGTFREEIQEAISLLAGKHLVLMHGFQGYPTPLEDNQLSRIQWLKAAYPAHKIGFADHVPESNPERLWLSVAAVAVGATVLEKHITSASVMREEDYESALNPDEFARYVVNMRQAYAAMGSVAEKADFGMSQSEQQYRNAMKKHVVAARDLPAGTKLTAGDLAMKRTSSTKAVLRDLRAAEGKRLKHAVPRDQT
ncbi:MAG: N-acetylneuraminate synthase family protein, partial [Burkholderiales bacterium]